MAVSRPKTFPIPGERAGAPEWLAKLGPDEGRGLCSWLVRAVSKARPRRSLHRAPSAARSADRRGSADSVRKLRLVRDAHKRARTDEWLARSSGPSGEAPWTPTAGGGLNAHSETRIGKIKGLGSCTAAPGLRSYRSRNGRLTGVRLYRIPVLVRRRTIALVFDGAAESGVETAVWGRAGRTGRVSATKACSTAAHAGTISAPSRAKMLAFVEGFELFSAVSGFADARFHARNHTRNALQGQAQIARSFVEKLASMVRPVGW